MTSLGLGELIEETPEPVAIETPEPLAIETPEPVVVERLPAIAEVPPVIAQPAAVPSQPHTELKPIDTAETVVAIAGAILGLFARRPPK